MKTKDIHNLHILYLNKISVVMMKDTLEIGGIFPAKRKLSYTIELNI
jgi:hypothetical protein